MADAGRGLPLLSGPPPAHPDSARAEIACRKCNKEFNVIFTRAKMCNHCGYSYCSSCTDYQALMPRSGPEYGYAVMPVCAYCIEFLTITASGRGQLKSMPLGKLKRYVDAYNIKLNRAVEKDDLIDAIMAARGQNGCLSHAHEEYYRKYSVPNRAGGRPRGLFSTRDAPSTPPPRIPPRPRPVNEFARPDLAPDPVPPPIPPRPQPQPQAQFHAQGHSHSHTQFHGQGAFQGQSHSQSHWNAQNQAHNQTHNQAHNQMYDQAHNQAHNQAHSQEHQQSQRIHDQAHNQGHGQPHFQAYNQAHSHSRSQPHAHPFPTQGPYESPAAAHSSQNLRPPTPPPRPRATSATPQATPRAPPTPPPTLDALLAMSAADIRALPISALKGVLFANRVSAGLVLEKAELVAKVCTLVEEERRVRARAAEVEAAERWAAEGGAAEEAAGMEEGEDESRGAEGEAGAAGESEGVGAGAPVSEGAEENHHEAPPPYTEESRTHTHPAPSASPRVSPHASPHTSPHASPQRSPPPQPRARGLAPGAQALAAALERTGLCVVCQDEEANIAIVDCGHLALCRACSDLVLQSTRECPLCRTRIVTEARLLRIFRT